MMADKLNRNWRSENRKPNSQKSSRHQEPTGRDNRVKRFLELKTGVVSFSRRSEILDFLFSRGQKLLACASIAPLSFDIKRKILKSTFLR